MTTFIGIIPARFASTRFPGKPLADIHGKPMIQHVYERAKAVLDNVIVATDDDRIYQTVISFDGEAVMTSSEHRSGTDRCSEALLIYQDLKNKVFDVVINIQGDEPFVQAEQINKLMHCFQDRNTQIATLIKPIDNKEMVFDVNKPKVVINKSMEAMYFSRSPIPFIRDVFKDNWNEHHQFYQHIGMYAYWSEVLGKITCIDPGILEKAESLEQLRWLENGFSIKTALTDHESFGIDTPEDLEHALKSGFID
jgi:3-deoxy-manno-octulosonate cytidylyltransferase (CMP-KDO synthetase)